MENISYLLIKVSRHLKNNLDNKLKKYDVTAIQFSVMNQIASKNSLITSAEIADILSSDRPTISGVINRLKEKGLVEKIYNPNDKRSSYLKLSKSSMELVNKLRNASDKLNSDILREFTEEEIKDMKRYLLKICKEVENV